MTVMVTTKYGLMDASTLVLKEEFIDDDRERTVVTEYYTVQGELVHRSAHVCFKENVLGDALTAAIFGR